MGALLTDLHRDILCSCVCPLYLPMIYLFPFTNKKCFSGSMNYSPHFLNTGPSLSLLWSEFLH